MAVIKAFAGALGPGILNAILALTLVFVPPIARVAESVTTPLATATLMARDFSVEIVETRSTACANSLHGTFRTLSLPVGITRS